MNGKALEQRTALAVSAWPVPLFPLGFSASNPVTGAESLACWGSLVPSLGGGASPGWVDSLLWSACLGCPPPPWVVPWRRSLWAILGLVSGW